MVKRVEEFFGKVDEKTLWVSNNEELRNYDWEQQHVNSHAICALRKNSWTCSIIFQSKSYQDYTSQVKV